MSEHKAINIETAPTDRDIKIVQYLANGERPKMIAEEMKVARKTIEMHIAIMKKSYGMRTAAGLVALFYRNKLIQ